MRNHTAALLVLPLLGLTPLPAFAQDPLASIGPAQLQAATAAMRSASVVVFGDTVQSPASWVSRYVSNNPARLQQVQAGELSYTDAVNYLKMYHVDTPFMFIALQRVMREVWGREPLGAEFQQYAPQFRTGQTWYIVLRTAEVQKLNDEYLRRQVVERAYLDALGRVPSPTDLAYWMPRKATYRTIYDGNVSYMFHPAHADELRATAARALAVARLSYSEQDVNSVAAIGLSQHRDYRGMLHWISERH
jgi:hypothetical protein